MASREWNNEGLEYRDWYKGIYKIWGPISAFPANHQKPVRNSCIDSEFGTQKEAGC